MRITFLLGNGFDVGLNLKTRYEDFYKVYKDLPSYNDNITDFKEEFDKEKNKASANIVDWSDFEKAFGEHSELFTLKSKRLYLERFEDFIQEFNAYMESEEKSADYDNINAIGKMMFDAIKTYYHIRPGDHNRIQGIYNHNNSVRVYNFVSFNYTNSVDNCTNALAKILENEKTYSLGDVVHVHGYIEKNMIVGVNDASQITNTELANDKEVVNELVKPQQNKDLKSTYDSKTSSIINNSDIICIYGMSLGATDKYWWDQIATWLSKDSNHMLIILAHEKKYNERFPFIQQRLMTSIRERFLSFSSLPDTTKASIENRILVEINHDIFAMDLREKIPIIGKEHLADNLDSNDIN